VFTTHEMVLIGVSCATGVKLRTVSHHALSIALKSVGMSRHAVGRILLKFRDGHPVASVVLKALCCQMF
jgi:hypothetical protein